MKVYVFSSAQSINILRLQSTIQNLLYYFPVFIYSNDWAVALLKNRDIFARHPCSLQNFAKYHRIGNLYGQMSELQFSFKIFPTHFQLFQPVSNCWGMFQNVAECRQF